MHGVVTVVHHFDIVDFTVLIGSALEIGIIGGAALGHVVGNRPGAVADTLIGAVACNVLINVVIFNPWFGGAFSLAPVACALATITALARWPAPDAPG